MLAKPFTHVVDNNTEELMNSLGQSTFQKVQYPALGSIPEANQVSYVEIEAPAQEARFLDEGTSQQRKDFLTNFYRQLLIRVVTITIFQLFSLMHWFRAIVIKSYIRHYYYSYHTYRWTFWTFFGIILALMLGTLTFRKTRFIKYTQTFNLHLQTILMSFLFVGLTGINIDYYYYGSIMWTTILSLIGIMGFIIVQLANIKYEFLKISPKGIISTTLVISFIINLIRAFSSSYIPSSWIFIEIFIPYPIYYFLQLNQSVQEPIYQEGECKCMIKEKIIDLLFNRNQINNEEQQAINQIGNEYLVIKKSHLKCALRFIVFTGLVLLSIFSLKFLIVLGVMIIQYVGILFQTQIVSNQKEVKTEFTDYNLAVCLMPFDLLFPIKNIKRSRWRLRRQ